jgi:hypothetical protein
MPTMTIFEPLFILLFLSTVVALLWAAAAALRGQGGRALKILRRLGLCAGVYFVVVALVAFATPQRVYHVGDSQCFDDWCITVVDAKRTPEGPSASWTVMLRLWSRARRVSQSEKGVVVYLTDTLKRRYDPIVDGSTIPLDTRLQPGQSVDAPRRFELPSDANGVGLIFTHEGGFPIGAFIIGEKQLFHPAAIVRFD